MKTRTMNALARRTLCRPAELAATRTGAEASGSVRTLASDEVHVWRASLDDRSPQVVASLQASISVDEAERARRFFFERDRQRFIVCRGILRTLLAGYVGSAPGEIVFRHGANGKPELAGGESLRPDSRTVGTTLGHKAAPADPIFFNVAHSEDLALFAFTRAGEIGVDVERIREMPDWPAIAEASFSAEELTRLQRCGEQQRLEEFFHAWTRQEAILKASGTGLAGTRERCGGFRVRALDVGPAFAAALAIDRRATPAALRSFDAIDQATHFSAAVRSASTL